VKQWHFYDKVYRRWIVIFIGSKFEFKKEMSEIKFNGLDEIDDTSQGIHIRLDETNNDSGQRCHVIWLPRMELGTLVHELGHLVLSIFDTCGVNFDQETFCFYQEFWFNEIRDVIKRNPRGRSEHKVK